MAYIIENNKRINYTLENGKVVYSDGKVATPSLDNIDVKKAYAGASIPVVVPPVVEWTVVETNSNEMDLGDISGKHIKFASGGKSPWAISFRGSNYTVDGSYFGESDGLSLYVGKGSNIEILNFNWKKHSYRPISIGDLVMKGVSIHHCVFRNVANSVISNDIRDFGQDFDGTEATAFLDWKVENCVFENTSSIFNLGSGFNYDTYKLVNVFKGLKFRYNTISGGSGNIVNQLFGEDIEIAFNKVDNYNLDWDRANKNAPNGPHNRIFGFTGSGDIHDNIVKNHQGNAFVISPATIFGELKASKVYNNTVFNSWKYSALELQTYPEHWNFIQSLKGTAYAKFFSAGAVKVYNNTVGRLNTSKDWEGQIIDLYNINASLEMYNNLGFELNRVQGAITDMINYNGNSSPDVKPVNNKYFPTAAQAVEDTTNFKSKFQGIGAQ